MSADERDGCSGVERCEVRASASEPIDRPGTPKVVRREVLEGALLAAQAQLRLALQRANEAERRAAAMEEAGRALVAWLDSAVATALPGALEDVASMASAATRSAVDALGGSPSTARARALLESALSDELRRALARQDAIGDPSEGAMSDAETRVERMREVGG